MKESDIILCRGCLKQLDYEFEKVYLFNDYSSTVETPVEFYKISDLFSKYTFLNVDIADELTSYICFDCYEQLTNFHAFRKICVASYFELLKRKHSITKCCVSLQSGKPEIIVKEENIEDGENYDLTESLGFDDGFAESDDDIKQEEEKIEEQLLIRCDKPSTKSAKKRSNRKQKVSANTSLSIKKEPRNGSDVKETNGKKFNCDQCQKIFNVEYRYKAHLRFHQGLKPYECDQCKKQFAGHKCLAHHIAKIHSGVKFPEYICGINDCGKAYLQKSTLLKHMFNVHLENYEAVKKLGKVICEICGHICNSNYALKLHSARQHEGIENVKCPYCSKSLAQASLSAHIRYNHEYGKKHICPICGLAKPKRSELLTHINFHTKETKYPCNICGKVFYLKNKVNTHVRVVHQGLKNYICPYCNKAFGSAQTLRDHKMMHTGKSMMLCCKKRSI